MKEAESETASPETVKFLYLLMLARRANDNDIVNNAGKRSVRELVARIGASREFTEQVFPPLEQASPEARHVRQIGERPPPSVVAAARSIVADPSGLPAGNETTWLILLQRLLAAGERGAMLNVQASDLDVSPQSGKPARMKEAESETASSETVKFLYLLMLARRANDNDIVNNAGKRSVRELVARIGASREFTEQVFPPLEQASPEARHVRQIGERPPPFVVAAARSIVADPSGLPAGNETTWLILLQRLLAAGERGAMLNVQASDLDVSPQSGKPARMKEAESETASSETVKFLYLLMLARRANDNDIVNNAGRRNVRELVARIGASREFTEEVLPPLEQASPEARHVRQIGERPPPSVVAATRSIVADPSGLPAGNETTWLILLQRLLAAGERGAMLNVQASDMDASPQSGKAARMKEAESETASSETVKFLYLLMLARRANDNDIVNNAGRRSVRELVARIGASREFTEQVLPPLEQASPEARHVRQIGERPPPSVVAAARSIVADPSGLPAGNDATWLILLQRLLAAGEREAAMLNVQASDMDASPQSGKAARMKEAELSPMEREEIDCQFRLVFGRQAPGTALTPDHRGNDPREQISKLVLSYEFESSVLDMVLAAGELPHDAMDSGFLEKIQVYAERALGLAEGRPADGWRTFVRSTLLSESIFDDLVIRAEESHRAILTAKADAARRILEDDGAARF